MALPMVTWELHGFKELEKTLSQLPDRVIKNVAQQAVTGAQREGAQKAIAAAAPRGTIDKQSPISKKWGPLHKNIKAKKLKRVPKWVKGARIDTGNAPQGFWYEKGTRHQPARPWFLPAYTRAIDTVLQILRERVGSGIEKEAEKK